MAINSSNALPTMQETLELINRGLIQVTNSSINKPPLLINLFNNLMDFYVLDYFSGYESEDRSILIGQLIVRTDDYYPISPDISYYLRDKTYEYRYYGLINSMKLFFPHLCIYDDSNFYLIADRSPS